MNYMLLIHSDPNSHPPMESEEMRELIGEYQRFLDAIKAAGVLRGSNRLHPADTATTVRVRDGELETTDGPFIETQEQFGGYFIIEVDDLDAAIEWASKIPGAKYGSIEVRPAYAEAVVTD